MSLQHQTLLGHCEKDGCATSGLLPLNGRRKRRNASLIRAQMCYFLYLFLAIQTAVRQQILARWFHIDPDSQRLSPGLDGEAVVCQVSSFGRSILFFSSSAAFCCVWRRDPRRAKMFAIFFTAALFPSSHLRHRPLMLFFFVIVTVIAPSGRARACVCVDASYWPVWLPCSRKEDLRLVHQGWKDVCLHRLPPSLWCALPSAPAAANEIHLRSWRRQINPIRFCHSPLAVAPPPCPSISLSAAASPLHSAAPPRCAASGTRHDVS